MWLRTMISEGASRSACAARIARSIASTSSESAIDCTCQPCASNRFALSSVVKVSAVVPSIVMWLSS